MKIFPNKNSVIFVSIFFLMYLCQQPTRREDWPFSFFGMYRGGRHPTKPYYKFEIIYKDKSQEFSPYIFPVDYYFVDEKLREILLGRKEAFNNDLLANGTELLADKKEDIEIFLKKNIVSLVKKNCPKCKDGVVVLKVKYWDYMKYENYHSPDREYSFAEVALRD